MKLNRTVATEYLVKAVHDFIDSDSYVHKNSDFKLEKINDGQMKFNFPTSGLEIKPITQQATEMGIKFYHQMWGHTRYTVAYRPVSERGRMLEIALAYTHPKDQYCKRTGARLAAERFMDGKTVVMPLRGGSPEITYHNLASLFRF